MKFYAHKLIKERTSTGQSFSRAAIGTEVIHKVVGSRQRSCGVSFPDCFEYNGKIPIITHSNFMETASSESTLFHNFVENGLRFLGKVKLNPQYKSYVDPDMYIPSCDSSSSADGDPSGDDPSGPSDSSKPTCGPLGIGSRNLWWGEPDACVRPLDKTDPTAVVATCLPDADETDGESSQIEAKTELHTAQLPQAVAIAVVHAFTQHSRHPESNPMVPTVLINGTVFKIILYDCQNDVLLVSSKVRYNEGGKMTPLGSLVLWLTINHRYVIVYICIYSNFALSFCREYLKPFTSVDPTLTFGLRDYATSVHLLEEFESLKETNINWTQRALEASPGVDEFVDEKSLLY